MPNYLASMTERGFKGITSYDLNVSVSLLITIIVWIKINPYHGRASLIVICWHPYYLIRFLVTVCITIHSIL
jgi:hypothetical protein